ncbi:MAG: hypothetical protein DRP86_06860 [Candidatus Neomarinimicrobiota bacterium]|nr:MAG: hypothetical protein DRP86_06860 [Candidatus Neomarinimicrobiota bacterium]
MVINIFILFFIFKFANSQMPSL